MHKIINIILPSRIGGFGNGKKLMSRDRADTKLRQYPSIRKRIIDDDRVAIVGVDARAARRVCDAAE